MRRAGHDLGVRYLDGVASLPPSSPSAHSVASAATSKDVDSLGPYTLALIVAPLSTTTGSPPPFGPNSTEPSITFRVVFHPISSSTNVVPFMPQTA